MIEKKLKRGEVIALGDIDEQRPAGHDPEISVGCENRNIGISAGGFGPTTRSVKSGTNIEKSKGHRNFIWLPYVPTKINFTISQGIDVLSGKFSGCYMIAYKAQGARRVAHIATPEAKALWNQRVAQMNYEILAGFQPMESIDLNDKHTKVSKLDYEIIFFGLITATDSLYSVVLGKLDAKGTKHMVKKVQHVPSLSREVLRNLPVN